MPVAEPPARRGTTSLFAALNTKTGALIGQTQRRHRSVEFRNFLDTIVCNVPEDLDIHLILDNYGTNKNATDWRLAGKKAALPFALHAYFGQLDQSGRTMVRSVDGKTTPPQRTPLYKEIGTSYRNLHPHLQQ